MRSGDGALLFHDFGFHRIFPGRKACRIWHAMNFSVGEQNVMRKERICWVLPLLLASSGAAWADTDVTIYGYADVSVDEINNGLKTQPLAGLSP